MKKTAYLLETLKDRGYRATEERQKIIKSVSDRHARSLASLMEATGLGRETAYRNLRLLKKEGFLHESIIFPNYYYLCEVDDEQSCHQTLLCRRCKRVEEQSVPEHKHPFSKRLKVPVQNHEFLSLCKTC